MNAEKKQQLEYAVITLFSMLGIMVFMASMLGNGLSTDNPYNTYSLQADSWRQGRLHLGHDYPWLELAIFEGKYYCSFPPFPSYVLFPFTFFYGSDTPDFRIMYVINILLTVYLYKLALKLGTSPQAAMFLTLFVTISANTLFIMQKPSVWFFAQLLCVTTAVMAIYYAYIGKGSIALFWWACSVGCRPMQIVFLPVLLVFLYVCERQKQEGVSGVKLILNRWYWIIPMTIVALSYMLLNYFRFGSVFEFGHNYLPEFVRAEKGQFHVDYMANNIKSLFHLPEVTDQGKLVIDHFGNLNFMLASPIVIAAILGLVYATVQRDRKILGMGLLTMVLVVIYLIITVMHRTMGGWHFGNRYTIDILPYIFVLVGLISAKYPKLVKYYVPLCVYGCMLNVVGTIVVFNGW